MAAQQLYRAFTHGPDGAVSFLYEMRADSDDAAINQLSRYVTGKHEATALDLNVLVSLERENGEPVGARVALGECLRKP